MIVKQKLSILVLPKWKKTDSEGLTPIYLRITIDGLQEELSTSVKVRRENWNEENGDLLGDKPSMYPQAFRTPKPLPLAIRKKDILVPFRILLKVNR